MHMETQVLAARPEHRNPGSLRICVIGSSRSRHVCQRARALADRGHAVTLLTDTYTGAAGVTELAPTGFNIPRLRSLSQMVSYYRTIIRCRPDLIHIHYACGTGPWVAALTGLKPMVVSTMGGDILFKEQGAPSFWEQALTCEVLRAADIVTVKSERLANIARELAGANSEVMKVTWGVDTRVFHRRPSSQLRRNLGLSLEDRVILSPKILHPFYNIDLIVAALPAVLTQVPRAQLLLTEYLADQDYRLAIEAQVARLGLGRHVHFIGAIPQEEMPDYYSLADVVVAVPPSDGLPQAMLEAMACGTPNVLSRLPHYQEFVTHEQSVYLVDISVEDIAAGIIRLLTDLRLRRQIIANGGQVVQSVANFEQEVNRLEARFHDLVLAGRARLSWARRGRVALFLLLHLFLDGSRQVWQRFHNWWWSPTGSGLVETTRKQAPSCPPDNHRVYVPPA